MFDWIWDNIKEFGEWLFNLPSVMGEVALAGLMDALPESVLEDIAPFITWLRMADEWVPIHECFGMLQAAWLFEVTIIGIRFVYKLIRGS